MYFSKAAIALASIPVFGFSVSNVLASELPNLTAQPLEALPQQGPGDSVALPVNQPVSQPVNQPVNQQRLPLSPGDRVSVQIPGNGGEEFSGEYEVNFNGDLEIPLIEPVPVVGLVATEVQTRLRERLLQQQFFRPELLRVNVQVLDFSPIQIAVTGEVFEPGRILLSNRTPSATTTESSEDLNGGSELRELPGDYPLERYLTAALKATGGIRPTADISRVQVLRGTQSTIVDLSGVFSGSAVTDFPLVAGDQIIIPDAGEFQASLVRPSQITPDSVNLYVSNVTEPSGNSSLNGSSEINVASFQYGTNLAQALVSARCVGGTESTNANRRALLIQTDPLTGALKTSEYSVRDLISSEPGSANENPYLMPEDAIACYDSRNTNVRGILGTVVDFLNPVNLLIDLFD
jgi:polysaccharide biosynthesis/export protein